MRALRLLLVIAAMAASPSARAAPDVVVRTKLDPAEGVVVGQPVRFLVDVLFRGAMPRPPRVRIGEAPGAQILRFETQAVTMQDRIDGEDYTGQRFEFAVFPRRGGTLQIPAPQVTLLDAAGDPTGEAAGEAESLAVTVPPGIDASGPVLAASKVTVAQSWQPDPAAAPLKPGGAVTRTIRREAAGVPALGMADFAFTAPAGVRLYVDPPLADDHVDRGAVRGLRTDKVTYVFETDGRFDLPALTQPWYDLGARTARSENLPGASVTVAPAPSGPAQGSAGPARRWLALGAAAFAALALAFALLRLLPKMRALGDERRRLYAESEASARDALRQAAASGNAPAAYDALGAWLRRLPAEERRRIRADADFAPLVEALERTLFGSRGSWSDEDGRALARLVRDWRIGVASRATASSSALPPLNPAEP